MDIRESKRMFSNNLKTAIGKRSIADLADETKLNRQQIYRYVKGTALPRADAYLALCQELEIDPSIALNKDIFAAESSQLNLPQQPITKHLTTPDDNCMAEGLYHVYCPSIRRPGKFGRHTLALKLNKGWLEACWQVAFKTIPYSVPANLRVIRSRMPGAIISHILVAGLKIPGSDLVTLCWMMAARNAPSHAFSTSLSKRQRRIHCVRFTRKPAGSIGRTYPP